ncbi:unnamed protein product [Clavelina lepadiformis]|uniref:Uncharacterized protein n=1 Tax=Clavelina lepadiformis TaxID=159417 RepID=A0ABP0GD08_CLALP
MSGWRSHDQGPPRNSPHHPVGDNNQRPVGQYRGPLGFSSPNTQPCWRPEEQFRNPNMPPIMAVGYPPNIPPNMGVAYQPTPWGHGQRFPGGEFHSFPPPPMPGPYPPQRKVWQPSHSYNSGNYRESSGDGRNSPGCFHTPSASSSFSRHPSPPRRCRSPVRNESKRDTEHHNRSYRSNSYNRGEDRSYRSRRETSHSSSRHGHRMHEDGDRRSSTERKIISASKRSRSENTSDDDISEIESQVDIEEEIKTLKASYVQCTQHGNMYKRIMHSDSTVEGTEKLKDLFDRFETQLSNRHKSLWRVNEHSCASARLPSGNVGELINFNQSNPVTMKKIQLWNHHVPLTRHQRVKSTILVKKLTENAAKQDMTIETYLDEVQPSLPNFALSKLKSVIENGGSLNDDQETDDDDDIDRAGEVISNIRKIKAHPDRLHDELWYNEPLQANDGPLCHCTEDARVKGIRHNIYPGEDTPLPCHSMRNNIGKLHHYRVMVGPAINFMSSAPTLIEHNGHDFMFEGFSIFSHEPLDKIPLCDIIRFHIRYTIYLIEETPPENFCMRGMELYHEYLFREILELYDWQAKDNKCPENNDAEYFRKFRFYPRFVRSLPDNGKEILSLCKVLEYLLENDKPLVSETDLDWLMKCSHKEWLDYTEKVRGMIVTLPGKKPSSLRVDQLDRYDRKPLESTTLQGHAVDDRYPMIVHFGIRPANLSYAGDPTYQRIWRAYLKLRHLMANSPKVKASDKQKLKERENALQKFRRSKDMQREVTVELSSQGFRRTGIFSDICQHALLLPVLTHHLRYHLCLRNLEKTIGYQFKERKWLSHAMNHPSCQMNFGLNPDHVRNALSNCGLRLPRYGDSSIHYKYTRKRGITTLIRIMARLGQQRPVLSPIEHNERLEFLGDAVVGYFTSVHLFLMFPDLSEGALTTFRTVLVNNLHLALLAERLQLDEYMLYAHGPDLCRKADLRHAMANCFEALMGAIFMEAGLEKAQELFGRFLWETIELQNVWKDLPLHPLQEEEPISDRRCIKGIPILQKLTKFEDSIGVQFDHIRLLAKAFTWRNVHENILTHGHNQRLEFLGDSVCNLVASTYLFKLYPTHHEGHLTLLRATVVNGRTQSLVATELGMPEYVICNLDSDNPGGRAPEWREKNLADLLEAFVASLFLDKGLEYVEGFMKVCFFPRLKEFILTQEWNDPKSCLQQCCLTLRQEGKEPQLPTYEISQQAGPSHARKYVISVYFKGKEIGKGSGESIQRAERNAARKALNEYNFPQLEWQRRYVAEKHDLPYQPRSNLKKIEVRPDEHPSGPVKKRKKT